MIVLHIVNSHNSKTNGVQVIVPQYVMTQNEHADVRLVNYTNVDCETGDLQLEYRGAKGFPDYLPAPYNNPDLVVFNEVNLIEHIKVYRKLLKKHIPYIIIPHGELTQEALRKKWLKKKIAYFLLFNHFINNAKAIQCLSEGEKCNIKIKTPSKFVSTNGIFDYEEKKENFSDNGLKLLYIGRLELKVKGFDLLFEALSEIKKESIINDLTLDIFGPDILGRLDVLKELVNTLDINDIVSFHPSIFNQDKVDAMLQHDIFIQTSRTEGMPVGIIEAMNIGLPVIITKGTNLTSDITDKNYGYDAGCSVKDIKDAIIAAYNDRENWKQKSQNAILYTQNNLTWNTISKNCLEFYLEFINA